MKRLSLFIALLFVVPVFAVPSLQMYAPGAEYYDKWGEDGKDEDTWIIEGKDGGFAITAVAAKKSNITEFSRMTLAFSVPTLPEDTPVISVYDLKPSGDGPIVPALGVATVPTEEQMIILSGFNNHYPFRDAGDVLVYEFYTFAQSDAVASVNDYGEDYEPGDTPSGPEGFEKSFWIEFSPDDFKWVHVDLYGLVKYQRGPNTTFEWEINPGSHDVTDPPETSTVPVPGAFLLAGLGTGMLGFMRRRRSL